MSVAVRRLVREMTNVRRLAVCIFIATLAAFVAVSPQAPVNFQVVTRLAVPLSFVEQHKLNIDTYADWTSDKAEWNGHFYADKPPGHPILALPSVVVVRGILGLLGRPVQGTHRDTFAIYAFWATVTVNGLISALAASALFTTAVTLGASLPGALFGTTAFALGTPFFGWSSAFFAHSVSASLLILAFSLAVRLLTDEAGTNAKDAVYWSVQLGGLLGYASVVELTAAPIAAIAGIVFVVLIIRRPGSRSVVMAVAAICGGILGFLPLPIYNYFAFGSPFHLGYASVVGWEGMQQGFFGITLPNPWVALELIFGAFRGLLPLSPVLILAPVGLIAMLRHSSTRLGGVICLVVFAYYLALNTSYHYWEGGWSMGPRHVVAALPFLGLALCFAWPRRRILQLPALLLLVVSLEFSLIAAAGGMFPPEKYKVPLYEFALDRLMSPTGELWRVPLVVLVWLVFCVLAARVGAINETATRAGVVPETDSPEQPLVRQAVTE